MLFYWLLDENAKIVGPSKPSFCPNHSGNTGLRKALPCTPLESSLCPRPLPVALPCRPSSPLQSISTVPWEGLLNSNLMSGSLPQALFACGHLGGQKPHFWEPSTKSFLMWPLSPPRHQVWFDSIWTCVCASQRPAVSDSEFLSQLGRWRDAAIPSPTHALSFKAGFQELAWNRLLLLPFQCWDGILFIISGLAHHSCHDGFYSKSLFIILLHTSTYLYVNKTQVVCLWNSNTLHTWWLLPCPYSLLQGRKWTSLTNEKGKLKC